MLWELPICNGESKKPGSEPQTVSCFRSVVCDVAQAVLGGIGRWALLERRSVSLFGKQEMATKYPSPPSPPSLSLTHSPSPKIMTPFEERGRAK